MNIDLMKKWIAALRSGEYKQGTGSLHKLSNQADFYCCLGVLCEVAIANGASVKKSWDPYVNQYSYDSCMGCLPHSLKVSVGINADFCQLLMDKNDSGSYTFEQIAKIIEVHMVKRLWLDALKSGKYKQGKGHLCSTSEKGDRHCCLGVLCELAVEHSIVVKDVSGFCCFRRFKDAGDDEALWAISLPPECVVEWAGLTTKKGILRNTNYKVLEKSLVEVNDYDASDNYDRVIELIEKGLPFKEEFSAV